MKTLRRKKPKKTKLGQRLIAAMDEAISWQKGWNAGFEAGLEKGSKLVVGAVTGKVRE